MRASSIKNVVVILLFLCVLSACTKAEPKTKSADEIFMEETGCSPLHIAVMTGPSGPSGSIKEMRKLIEEGADVNARDNKGYTPLHWALRIHSDNEAIEAAELLIVKGADMNAKDNKFGFTPLHWTVESGKTELAEFLITKGADVNARDKCGYTPLHWAVENNNIKAAALLQKHGGVETWQKPTP